MAHPQLSQPLAIAGVERTLFILIATVSYAVFTILSDAVTALVLFGALYLAGRWVTAADPAMIRVVRANLTARPRYDPGRHARAWRRIT